MKCQRSYGKVGKINECFHILNYTDLEVDTKGYETAHNTGISTAERTHRTEDKALDQTG